MTIRVTYTPRTRATGHGRPRKEVPPEVLAMLRNTDGSESQAEIDVSRNTPQEIEAFRFLLQCGVRDHFPGGTKLHTRCVDGVLSFWVDR